MKVITTTKARERFAELVNYVRYTHKPVPIGRRNRADVLLIAFPEHDNTSVDDVTNMNQYGRAFDFLEDEPELYTVNDLKKKYV